MQDLYTLAILLRNNIPNGTDSVKKRLILIALGFLATPVFADTSNVSAELVNIRDKSAEDFSADVKLHWDFPDSDYVIISHDKESIKTSRANSILTSGGIYYFIGVKDNDLKLHMANSVWKWKQGTGIHGIVHSLGKADPRETFQSAFHSKVDTNLSLSAAKERTVIALQEMHFAVETSDQDDKVTVTTTNFQPDSSLCKGDDCSKPIGERTVERQVAWSILLGPISDSKLSFDIKPIVMKNFRRQDQNWIEDNEGVDIAMKATQDLNERLMKTLGKARQ